jgi:hypothetical protein
MAVENWGVGWFFCKLLRKGHSYLDRSGDGIACKSLRKG